MVSFILTLKRLLKGLWRAFKLKNFQALLTLVLMMLLSGTIFYSKQEGLEIIDALYFSVATLSTVGHPTFAPATTFGKIFTMVFMVGGIGIFLALVGSIAYALIKDPDLKEEEKKASLK